MVTRSDVHDLSRTDPIVQRTVELWYRRDVEWDQAMMLAVIELSHQCNLYKDQLTNCLTSQTRPILISTEEWNHE